MRKYCVYAFVDQNKIPFYIGITCNFSRRMRNHANEVRKGNHLPKYNKMRQLLSDGRNIMEFVKVMEDNILTADIAFEREITTIASLRQSGHDLKNLTDGGEGNINPTPEQIEKVRLANTGQKRSKECRKRMSDSRMGMVFTEEHKRNLAKAWLTRPPMSNITRIKRVLSAKGKINIKRYELTSPSGEKFVTEKGLNLFCEQHGLTASNLCKVIHGKKAYYKGWTGKTL